MAPTASGVSARCGMKIASRCESAPGTISSSTPTSPVESGFRAVVSRTAHLNRQCGMRQMKQLTLLLNRAGPTRAGESSAAGPIFTADRSRPRAERVNRATRQSSPLTRARASARRSHYVGVERRRGVRSSGLLRLSVQRRNRRRSFHFCLCDVRLALGSQTDRLYSRHRCQSPIVLLYGSEGCKTCSVRREPTIVDSACGAVRCFAV